MGKGERTHSRAAESREGGTAVFAHDVAADVLWIDLIVGSNNLTVAESIQSRSGAENLAFRIVELIFGDVGDCIDRIRYQDDDGIFCVPGDACHDFAYFNGILFAHQRSWRHIFTRARLLTDARGNDDDVGIGAIRVIAGVYFTVCPVAGGQRMAVVKSLASCRVLVAVDQDDIGK